MTGARRWRSAQSCRACCRGLSCWPQTRGTAHAGCAAHGYQPPQIRDHNRARCRPAIYGGTPQRLASSRYNLRSGLGRVRLSCCCPRCIQPPDCRLAAKRASASSTLGAVPLHTQGAAGRARNGADDAASQGRDPSLRSGNVALKARIFDTTHLHCIRQALPPSWCPAVDGFSWRRL